MPKYYCTFVVPHSVEIPIHANTLTDAIAIAKDMDPCDLPWDLLEDVSGTKLDSIYSPDTKEEWEE